MQLPFTSILSDQRLGNLPLPQNAWRYVVMPSLCWLIVHFFIYGQLPFSPNYQFPWHLYFPILGFGLIICEGNHQIHLWLNKEMPLKRQPSQRTMVQFFIGIMASALVFGIYYAYRIKFAGVTYNTFSFLLFLGIILSISILENSILLLKGFNRLMIQGQVQNYSFTTPTYPNTSKPLEIKSGKSTFYLDYVEVAYLYSKKGVVILVREDGKTIITNHSSLNEIEKILLPQNFFRINRQVLAQAGAIKSFVPEVNSKVSVTLHPTIPILKQDTVTISRHKSAAFKKWLSASYVHKT